MTRVGGCSDNSCSAYTKPAHEATKPSAGQKSAEEPTRNARADFNFHTALIAGKTFPLLMLATFPQVQVTSTAAIY